MIGVVNKPLIPRIMFTGSNDPRLTYTVDMMEEVILSMYQYRVIFDEEDQDLLDE